MVALLVPSSYILVRQVSLGNLVRALGVQLSVNRAPHPGQRASKTAPSVAVVITTCTHRKKIRPQVEATAVSLPLARQDVAVSAWFERLEASAAVARARELYAGRGFGLAVQAAAAANAKLCVLSAGLGLVEASQRVPSYGLTVTPGRPESLPDKVSGEFDPAAWFSAVLGGPYSRRWTDVIGCSGRILLTLSRPYAEMVGASLLELDGDILSRLRIFGAALSGALPAELGPSVTPYDRRLDAILPGTRVDFSQRALSHFVNSVLPNVGTGDRDSDFAEVAAALKHATAPERKRRPRRSDEEILRLISARLDEQTGIGGILRALRHEEGVACEQSRFTRLYRMAVERKIPA